MDDKTKIIQIGDEVLDMSRKTFSDRLMEIKKQGFTRIGLDLSKRPFLNSEAIGVIAYNYIVLHDMGTELFILNPSTAIKDILESTALEKVIRVEFKEE